MKRPMSVMIAVFILFPVLVEGILRLSGVNDLYRRSHPSFLIRDDPEFLHRVRENLDIDAPRHAHLRLGGPGSGMMVPESFHVRTDSQGFREKVEIPHKSARTGALIVCAGDSATFGWGSHDEDAYPQILETLLQNHFSSDIQVVNAGQPGFSSYQGMLFYDQVVSQLSPDLVIVAFGHNDHHIGIQGFSSAKQKFTRLTSFPDRLRFTARQSDFYLAWQRFFMAVLGRIRSKFHPGPPEDLDHPGSVDEFGDNLLRYSSMVRRDNADFLILTEPRNSPEKTWQAYNEEARIVAERHDLTACDVAAAFNPQEGGVFSDSEMRSPPPNDYFWDDIHPTAKGNRLMAQVIVDFLEANRDRFPLFFDRLRSHSESAHSH